MPFESDPRYFAAGAFALALVVHCRVNRKMRAEAVHEASNALWRASCGIPMPDADKLAERAASFVYDSCLNMHALRGLNTALPYEQARANYRRACQEYREAGA